MGTLRPQGSWAVTKLNRRGGGHFHDGQGDAQCSGGERCSRSGRGFRARSSGRLHQSACARPAAAVSCGRLGAAPAFYWHACHARQCAANCAANGGRACDADGEVSHDTVHHRVPGVWVPLWSAFPAHQQRAPRGHGWRRNVWGGNWHAAERARFAPCQGASCSASFKLPPQMLEVHSALARDDVGRSCKTWCRPWSIPSIIEDD